MGEEISISDGRLDDEDPVEVTDDISDVIQVRVQVLVFIDQHLILHSSQTIAPRYVVVVGRNSTLSPMCETRTLGDQGVLDNRKFSLASPRGHHLGHDNRCTEIYCLSCCDGVLFVEYPIRKRNELSIKHALWNPVTGDTKAVPIDLTRYKRFLENYGFVEDHGCGFDSKNNEYKPFSVRSDTRLYSTQIQIYSFTNKKWKLIEYPGIISHGSTELEMVYANGNCHWVGFNSLIDRHVVISFYTTNENDIVDDDKGLAVAGTRSFGIWVLGEYGNKDSWTKLFTIGPLPGIEQVVGFWNETEIFVTDGDSQLFLYDTVSPQALNLPIRRPVSMVRVFICRQNLCPIVDQDQVLSLNKKWQLRLGSKRKKMKTKWSDGNHNRRQRFPSYW